MNGSRFDTRLALPASLQDQLQGFRRRVWTIKMIEAGCGRSVGVVIAYLAVFAIDRLIDTPAWARLAIFVAALAACSVVPVYAHRWIWRHRRPEQLARLVSRRFPSLGDQLLGVIELVRNDFEQARSRALVEAAIGQVAEETAQAGLARGRARLRGIGCGSGLAFGVMTVVLVVRVVVSGRGRKRLGPVAAPWARRAPLHIHRPSSRSPTTWSCRTASRCRWSYDLRRRFAVAAARGMARIGSQAPVAAAIGRRRLRIRLARRRSTPAGSICASAIISRRSRSSRWCGPS